MKLTIKQTKALDYLEDNETIELLFGGGAGGGKSAFGCYWQLKNRLKYPGTRGLIGRSKLKALKDTTLKTFFEIADMQGLKRDKHYWLTGSHDKENPNCIMFANGSMIYLKDLFQYPSDENFDSLGSFEISDAFIDECSQVVEKAKDVVKSRIRYKLDNYCHVCGDKEKKAVTKKDSEGKAIEWTCTKGHSTQGLIPKILMTCNPAKNWVYATFYKPFKEKKLPSTKKFIQSLLSDNPYITKHYKTTLLTMAKDMVERLLYGNWEYNDDPLLLFKDYDKILDIFTNKYIEPTGRKYMTCDIAYEGSDIFVIGIWDGLILEKIYAFDKVDETQVSATINKHRIAERISISNVAYDADGLKRFVRQSTKTGSLAGAISFKNGSKALGKEKFANLKTQCYFLLADMVNKGQIYVKDEQYRKQIIEELEQIKQTQRNDDTEKIKLESKEKLKERLRRSPDFADMMMMRMIFELRGRTFDETTKTLAQMGINY